VTEKDDAAIKALKDGVLVQLEKYDENGNHLMSQAEMEKVMADPQAQRVFHDFGIDIQHLVSLQEMIFAHPGTEVSFHTIMEMMLSSRKDLPATFRHLAENQELTRYFLSTAVSELDDRLITQFEELLLKTNGMGCRRPCMDREPPTKQVLKDEGGQVL